MKISAVLTNNRSQDALLLTAGVPMKTIHVKPRSLFHHHVDRKRLRRGNIFGLFAALLPVLGVLVALSVNSAYMQLSRTQLMVATDCAAQAGGRALSEYQNVDTAKSAAQATAALNTVASNPLRLSTSDADNEIEFGKTTYSGTGDYVRFQFQKLNTADVRSGAQKASAVRITGKKTQTSMSGAVNLVFPSFSEKKKFEPSFQAVSMQVDRDISLVIDRSGSMGDITWNWPSGKNPLSTACLNAGVTAGYLTRRSGTYYYTSGNNQTTYYTWAWETYFKLGPAPRMPWTDCVTAVNTFLDVLGETPQQELVSLASYASTASLNTQLESNYTTVRNAIAALSPSGNTAIGSGMTTGMTGLANVARSRPNAARTMVVMTDGIHNTGTDPVTVARTLMGQYDMTIHTVTFGAGADISRMQQVASIGGGRHYHAENGTDLIAIFEEIANNLATIITE